MGLQEVLFALEQSDAMLRAYHRFVVKTAVALEQRPPEYWQTQTEVILGFMNIDPVIPDEL